MSLSLALLIGATLSLIAGAVLLWFGRRGRLIDDHPYCRGCDFDLFGLPESTERCSECGNFLTDTRGYRQAAAIRIGRRARRPAMFAWGLALAIPAALWLASIGLSVLAGVDVERHKPDWLLAWEGDGSSTSAARAVLQLTTRLQAGSLPAARVQSLAADFLDDQADTRSAWLGQKGNFIESAHVAAILAPGQWERYVHQAIAPAFKVRPLVRFEGPVPIAADHRQLRFGTGSGAVFGRDVGGGNKGVAFRLLAGGADGVIYEIGRDGMSLGPSDAVTVGGSQMSGLSIHRPAKVPRILRYAVAVEEQGRNWPTLPRQLNAWPAHLWPVTIAAIGEPTVAASDHPEMADLTRQTLNLATVESWKYRQRKIAVPHNPVELTRSIYYRYDAPGAKGREERVEQLKLQFHRKPTKPWPIPVAWQALVRINGVEREARSISFPADASEHTSTVRIEPPKGSTVFEFGDAERIDVILRADPFAAEQTVGMTEFWNGGLTFEDVPVLREPSLNEP